MKNTRKSLSERAKELTATLPFMTGREKGNTEDLIERKYATIIDYGFLRDGDEEYVCFITKEDEKHFYFGGKVLTENLSDLDADGYGDEIRAEGLPTKFGEKQSKNKRTYTTVEFI